ncbi:glutamyl-tRNA reductase [Thiohalorhabdus methylotrophus]|uniref:Glutamyl-tRNA reductase n=1 Tax=Thiohalorhabdus methylotrophus TaxID=3242694 RepID=A0ABV4TS40_9GAMM
MHLLAIGVNHKTAPVAIREQVSFGPETLPDALLDLTQQRGVREGAILSTCNRTECYCAVPDPVAGREAIVTWLASFHGLTPEELEPHLYSYQDREAVTHVFRVAGSLDSLVVGEPQILGQLKDAYRRAYNVGSLGPLLNRVFHHAFKVGKRIRSETDIGGQAVSVSYAAVELARRIFGDLSDSRVLLIGAGETIQLAGRHLHEAGVSGLLVANRTLDRAEELARELDGRALSLEAVPDMLGEVDMVISSTGAPAQVLERAWLEQAQKRRKRQIMFMVDLAVPRDIPEDAEQIPGIYLYTVDDLQAVVEENLQARRQEAEHAEVIVEATVEEFLQWLRNQEIVPTIKAMRAKAEAIREQELERTRKRLGTTLPEEMETALEKLSEALVSKLLHEPTMQLRHCSENGNGEELIEATHQLFRLDEDS